MGIIIVGGVVKKDNKYLLVQEAKEKCRGKWNIPAGHLDPNETIFDGAKREIMEECGLSVNLTGIVNIQNNVMENDIFMGVIFSTEIVDGSISFDKSEILDVKWFTYDEIINMHNELRDYEWVTNAITCVENNKEIDLNIIRVVDKK